MSAAIVIQGAGRARMLANMLASGANTPREDSPPPEGGSGGVEMTQGKTCPPPGGP